MRSTVTKVFVAIFLMVFLGVFAAGCGQEAAQPVAKPKIVIATKPFAEQYILGNMMAQLLTAKADVDVDISKIGMGPTEMIHPAMVKGQIDIYPEYTGTAWMAILKQPVEHDKDVMYNKIKQMYADQFKLAVLPPLGFQNTFALTVTQEMAQKNNLKTIDDLAKLQGLTLVGDTTAFSRNDEYPGLKKVYGLDGTQKIVDVNFYYETLKQKQGDVALVFSTDGRLKQYNMVVLKDTKNFFPPYELVFIVRQEILDKYPKVQEVLNTLSGKIDDQTMTELNYQVEVEKKDPAEVAKAFLTSKGLL